MTVSVDVQSSISLVFTSAAGGCTLGNSGTNNVGLDLGWAQFTSSGQYSGCGTMVKINNVYQVSTPFNLVVNKANTTSGSYRVAAWLNAAPPANVWWILNPNGSGVGTTLSTSAQTLQTANAYGNTVETLAIQATNAAPAGPITTTINFLATAN